MAYQAWNRADMVAADNVADDQRSAQHQNSASFTPINNRTLLPPMTFNPLGRTLEGDALYELHDDHVPMKSAKSTKKRNPLPTGRVVSLGRAWEYEDGEDIYNTGSAFDENPPKRKKTTISKRSQSMKIPPTNDKEWDNNDSCVINGEGPKNQGSQLTAPSISKRKPSKVASKASKPIPRQTPAFKKPTITKPSVIREKKITRPSDSAISLQGWKSTEESVKSTPIVLAKTTMEKIASFRFKPPAGAQDIHVPDPKVHQKTSYVTIDNDPYAYAQGTIHGLSENGIPNEDSFFEDALWAVKEGDEFGGKHDNHQPSANLVGVSLQQHGIAAIDFGVEKPPGCINRRIPSVLRQTSIACPSWTSEDMMKSCEDPADSHHPPASQPQVLHKLDAAESDVGNTDQDVQVLGNDQVCSQRQSYYDEGTAGIGDEYVQFLPVHSPRQKAGLENATKAHVISDQFEPSDIDKTESIPQEASGRRWGSDEFDKGLDDDDLLGITSNTHMLQIQENVQSAEQKVKICGRFLLPHTPAVPESIAREHPEIPNVATGAQAGPFSSSSIRDIHTPDDEFPVDEECEKQMLKLSELGGIHEFHAPPESVENAFNNLADGEVYYSSLQFSPPKSLASGVSPSRVASDNRTDKNRITQSPGLERDSPSMGEEADWSFICFNEQVIAEALSDPFHDPPPTANRGVRSLKEISPPARPRVRQANVTSPVSKTNGESWSIIDDIHEYEPLNPFARPDFPALVLDRSPVVGLSAQIFLRTCFRIGEMFKEGIWRATLGQDAVIELFCRVTFSSRESGSTKQHFQFSDLWHDRPPYPNGLLANFKITGLAESESKVFLSEKGGMARCLGRFQRDLKSNVWMLHIINIRETDWEEIRWTKAIVNHGR